jgi:RNA polymerase sigma-70 factor (ECF subfamily)
MASPSAVRLAQVLGASATAELEEGLQRLLSAARERWPALSLSEATVVDHVAALLRAGGELTTLHADVVLAAGALAGDATAIREVDRLLRESAGRAALEEAPADELAAQLREELLVAGADGKERTLTRYSGKGPLRRWLSVIVIRAAVTARRRARRGGIRWSGDEALAELPSIAASPEVAALRRKYEGVFREALRDALATLGPEDRNLLRLHLVDGLGLDRLAPMLGVHRATAARRLAKTRSDLLSRVRERMRERANVDDREFESLAVVLLSRVEVSASFLQPKTEKGS